MICRDCDATFRLGDKMKRPSKRIANHESIFALNELMKSKLPNKLLEALTFSFRGRNEENRARRFSVGEYEDLTSTQAGRLIEMQAARAQCPKRSM